MPATFDKPRLHAVNDTSPQGDYSALTPDCIIDAVEARGHVCSGRMLALNSYENRVYRLDLEQGGAIVAKFYRPGRWSDAAIREEHAFAIELAEAEIPVVAPLMQAGETLFAHNGYRYALYPQQGGRWPDLESREQRRWLGRFLGRIHAIGRAGRFRHRNTLDAGMGRTARDYLLANGFLPAHIETAYASLCDDLLAAIDAAFARAGEVTCLRLHGDCHRGNILWTDAGPHFVDLDDCGAGPAIQDLWMLLDGEREAMQAQLCDLLEGYEAFAVFDARETGLIEALRSLRIMHYAAWLARRWQDPAFPQAFPWFNSNRYWEDHILELREQLARMQEPALRV